MRRKTLENAASVRRKTLENATSVREGYGLFFLGGIVMRLKFFRVDNEYTDKLRRIDPHVTHNNDDHENTYVGILLQVEDIKYFAPLTHTTYDNRWHQVPINITNASGQIVNRLGTILLHNMIPVYEDIYDIVDVDALKSTDIARYNLYQEQLNWMNIEINQQTIISKAEEVRRVYTTPTHKQYNYLKNILNCKLIELEREMIEIKKQL